MTTPADPRGPLSPAGTPERPALFSRRDLDALLEDPLALSKVRELPSTTLHRTIAAIGRSDASELLALASPEQVRELLDLEIWEGDRLQVEEAVDWLYLLSTLPEEVFARDVKALDVEVLGYALQRSTRIYLIQDEEEEIPDDPKGQLWGTPDGWFALDILEEDRTAAARLVEFLEAYYRLDPDAARRLLMNLRWELPTELEELSYRWRTGRLQDLGFADPEEALKIYAYLDPTTVSVTEGSADRLPQTQQGPPPTALVQALPQTDSFWQQAVSAVAEPQEQQRLSTFLLALSNRALSADRVSLSDDRGARRSLERLSWQLSLGLEQLCDGDLERAPQVLAQVALLRIARVGHSLVLDLRRELLPLLRQGRLGRQPGELDLLDPPLTQQIAGLTSRRPSYYDQKLTEARPFHDRADLERARGWLAQAQAAVTLGEALALPRPLPPALTYGDLFRTALINQRLEREGPLDRAALTQFMVLLPTLDVELLQREATAELPDRSAAAVQLVQGWIERLWQELAALDPGRLDLRYIDGLWLDSQTGQRV